jgi:hypothetical protein
MELAAHSKKSTIPEYKNKLLFLLNYKGKFRPRTGHKGPEGE